ncbi:ammonium transporter [Antrihabitans sp. YC2-6]|uniref:ammonium transporter n=1 Tax=Antrihabitans sp. YC2-6 TaxID=2799498 RepID=UPI0018F656C9|nr:ammonium transporter [Antrihabitans sp. YC2-6]MBJ8347599.1 ammonium transporter [Antrihabitans sp. YC2-6]
MRLGKTVAMTAMVVGAMGIASGTAYANPGASAPDVINFETSIVDRTIVTTIDAGAFQVRPDGKTIDLLDPAGNSVVNLPLSFSVAGLPFPYLHDVSNGGQTLSLTPDIGPIDARMLAQPVASLLENQRSQDAFVTEFDEATAIGTVIGTALGLVAGCIIGIPLVVTLIGWLGACATGAWLGGMLGMVIAGGPTIVVAGMDVIQTYLAPPGTTKWNYPNP